LAPGSNVFIGSLCEPVAVVAGVAVYGQGQGHVQYQVSWWDGLTRHLVWLEEFEVRATPNTPTVQIGFRNGTPEPDLVEAEREACAKLVESLAANMSREVSHRLYEVAAAIRNRNLRKDRSCQPNAL
jgi:hypothetical protein